MLKKLIPAIFRSKRHLLTEALATLPDVTYERLRDHGFRPKTIIDVGAWHGEWATSVAHTFPETRIVMFDALEDNRPYLEQITGPHFSYEICVLAAESGLERTFSVSGTGSSLYPERSDAQRSTTKVITKTLDEVLASRGVLEPILLKLDVQGAELEILIGGTNTLERSEVVQLEVALLKYNEGAPDFADVVSFMNDRDFKLCEIASFIRPTGRHLTQIDAIFARANSQLRPDFFNFQPI